MNQILDTTPGGYGGYTSGGSGGGSDKVVRVFAILLILFALTLIGVVGYGMYTNQKEVNNVAENATSAQISVEVNDTKAVIKVSHDKNIKKLIYSWNNSSERTKKYNEKYVEETIDTPAGDNTLHIKVIDENNFETTYDEEISSEKGVDIINPVIDLSVTEEKKLKIVATDETALDYITYRWNDDEEETVYASENDDKEIEVEIEILKGENDLTVVAVDGSSNTTTERTSFTGLTKPEIVVTLSEDGSSIDVKATHENGIESVKLNFNGQDFDVDIGNDNPTEIQFAQNLEVGENRIIVTVKSIDGTETKFDGQCTYGNSGDERSEEDSDSN